MTESLDELAERETKVLAHAEATVGTMEARERQLREGGTFAESAAIHIAYVILADEPQRDLKALKRAVFLAWYQTAEPACFTGVADLDPLAVARTYALLDRAVRDGHLDAELQAMLDWYQKTGYDLGFLIDQGRWLECTTPALKAFFGSLPGDAYRDLSFSPDDLKRRGQMGDYWRSIVCRPD